VVIVAIVAILMASDLLHIGPHAGGHTAAFDRDLASALFGDRSS
jgi:hypothetical protein